MCVAGGNEWPSPPYQLLFLFACLATHSWHPPYPLASSQLPPTLPSCMLLPHPAPPCPTLPCAQVDTHISRSRQILSTMSKRILQNKLIMWGIILLLLGAIGLVLWAKF